MSFGLTAKIRQGLGYDDVVDYNSTAYRVGGYVGTAINIGLMVVNPTGLAAVGARAIQLMGTISGAIDGVQAFRNGDWSAGGMAVVSIGLSRLPGAGTPCQAAARWGRMGPTISRLATYGQRGLSAVGVVQGAQSGVNRILQGDVVGGLLDLVSAGVSARRMMQSCFSGDTKLLTKDGYKRIDEFVPGDMLMSRNEFDVNGAVEEKVVEEVFVRQGRILHLHIGGQVIKTTAEHPFWVYNTGWLPAGELQVGDLLSSHDGQWVAVEETFDTSDVETVYNLRVADWHTYFVGDEGWTFSVWAHNSYRNDIDAVRDLAPSAWRFRTLASRLRTPGSQSIAGKNVAVVEYFDPTTQRMRTVTRISGRQGHAERRAIVAIQRRIGADAARENITRIYTEFSPCGPNNANCRNFIARNAPNARVGWLDNLSGGYLDHIDSMSALER